MKYDDSLFKKLSNGWMADECKVDWKKQMIKNYANIPNGSLMME